MLHLTRSQLGAYLGSLVLALSLGCRDSAPTSQSVVVGEAPETPDGPPWFEDVTEQLGVNFVHDPGGDLDNYVMHQIVGSGCAMVDLDGDGKPDLVLLTHGGSNSKSTNKLYRQMKDGKFEDVTVGSGLDFPGQNVGIAIADVNNDGNPDIVVTQIHGVRLLLNQGGMKFIDATKESTLANPSWGTSAAFLDFDRDGWLDLVIVNYVNYDPSWNCRSPSGDLDYCSPGSFSGTATRLYRNRTGELPPEERSRRVLFEDVTVKSRLGEKPGPGLGVAAADFDGDGWPDIFVANDGKPNHLWINKHDGTFSEESSLSRGVARTSMGHAFAGMGVAMGDIDNNGLFDLYITHLASESNTLWKQGPRGQFRDMSASWGPTGTRWRATGFGTVMADFDNDGWLDLAIANGAVTRFKQAQKHDLSGFTGAQPYGQRNQALPRTPAARSSFRDTSSQSSPSATTGRWLEAWPHGDFDGDGGQDLLVTAIGARVRLLRNIAPNRGHWVAVRAFDPALNRDAVGAEITALTGATFRIRLIGSGESYLSAGPLVAHFGLGALHAERRWIPGVLAGRQSASGSLAESPTAAILPPQRKRAGTLTEVLKRVATRNTQTDRFDSTWRLAGELSSCCERCTRLHVELRGGSSRSSCLGSVSLEFWGGGISAPRRQWHTYRLASLLPSTTRKSLRLSRRRRDSVLARPQSGKTWGEMGLVFRAHQNQSRVEPLLCPGCITRSVRPTMAIPNRDRSPSRPRR